MKFRFWVSVASLVSIGLSLGFTIGLSAALLYPWTQLGLLAPFLLLGIGVDDMFVILRTWDNVVSMPENKHKSIEEIAGSALSVCLRVDFSLLKCIYLKFYRK